MRDMIILARQFKKFRKRFHFTQTELGRLLGCSRDFVSDVETMKYGSIYPPTHRMFLALKARHEAERKNKNGFRRSNPSGEEWSGHSPIRMERKRDVAQTADSEREQ